MRLIKPDERIFRAFERAMDMVGGDILFFEDTPANAEAARAAGWRAEVVDPSEETAPQMRAHLESHGLSLGSAS
jgi:FMN phosphatase YigB (HAD superfamily)